MVGGWALRWATFSIPVLALTPLLDVSIAPATVVRGVVFLVSLLLSIAVATAVDFLFALLVIRAPENLWSFRMARDSVVPLVSGSVIPLALLPWSLGDALAWSPFASMVSAPLRIYTGDGPIARLLLLQAGWAVVLWVGTRAAWRKAAPRMVSFGG
jgi:ABC-2 type transport system permease protein